MKKIILFYVAAILSWYFFACSKSNTPAQQSSYQTLILGKWVYAHSEKYDSIFLGGGYATHIQSSNMDSNYNYLIFTDSGIAYSVQYAWGSGMSGVIYNDTMHYTMVDKNIFLSWPSGTNVYAGPTTFRYPAYQDTLTIRLLTKSSFTFNRNYHFKHFIVNTGELKYSIDSLIR